MKTQLELSAIFLVDAYCAKIAADIAYKQAQEELYRADGNEDIVIVKRDGTQYMIQIDVDGYGNHVITTTSVLDAREWRGE